MIVVCPYVELHERTRNRLLRLPTVFRPIDPDNPHDYEHMLRSFWEQGESFCIVEQDVVPPAEFDDVVLNGCCDYGCFPYAWLTDVGPALGCTWFTKTFLQKYPLAMARVAARNISWNQLDVVLMRHILARDMREQPHVHLPPAEHLNPAKQLLPEANPEPLMTIPHW